MAASALAHTRPRPRNGLLGGDANLLQMQAAAQGEAPPAASGSEISQSHALILENEARLQRGERGSLQPGELQANGDRLKRALLQMQAAAQGEAPPAASESEISQSHAFILENEALQRGEQGSLQPGEPQANGGRLKRARRQTAFDMRGIHDADYRA